MLQQLIYPLVRHAKIYNYIQQSVGSDRVWKGFIKEVAQVIDNWSDDDIWLDLGSGTSEVLEHLPTNIWYYGIDNNPKYIQFAKEKYHKRPNTTFHCGNWNEFDSTSFPVKTRIISALGLLHHLSDEDAQRLLLLGKQWLAPTGTLITLDGCREINRSRLEEFFYWIDRGQFIRDPDSLCALFPSQPTISIHGDWLRVPYRYALCRWTKS